MSAADVPKAELHVHLEGAFAPAVARKLAARNGMTLNEDLFDGENGYRWHGFDNFLAVFDEVSATLRTEQDYHEITLDYLARSALEGGIYAELICSPSHARMAGLPYSAMLRGIVAGIEDAAADHGIEAFAVMTGVRQFGVEETLSVIAQVAAEPHERVVGWHLSGDEFALSFADFAPAFAVACDAGLQCAAHAGEFGGPDAVRAAIAALPIARLGHGVQAAKDPALVDELAARGIALECCPTSNIATEVFADYSSHPWRMLRDAGCRVTLNSDDPPYFHTSIGGEYAVAADYFGLDDDALKDVTRTAIAAGFAPAAVRYNIVKHAGLEAH